MAARDSAFVTSSRLDTSSTAHARASRWAWPSFVALALVSSCSASSLEAPTIAMSLAGEGAFLDAPFPSEHLRRDDGTVDLSGLPDDARASIVGQIHDALGATTGFGTTSAIHLQLSTALDATTLPDGVLRASTDLVQLVVVDPDEPERGERAPIRLFYEDDGGPFGSPHMLTALPVQGMPLRGDTLYALVVREGLVASDGRAFTRAAAMDALAAGRAPVGDDGTALAGPGLDAYRSAFDALDDVGLDPDEVVGMTVFRTQDAVATLERAVRTTHVELAPTAPFEAAEVFDDYCVFRTTIDMPVYQSGTPPYASEGGAWVFDGSGALVLDHREAANLWVTLPRRPMPQDGFPLTMLVRTGAGGDRPLVDRGPHATAHGEPIAPGLGPARDFARAGWAGLQVDGPHGGLRNITGSDEQFLVFNIQNPTALRDNLRQSALELVLMARALEGLSIDASSCPDLEVPNAHFDVEHVVLLGHSMGASIAPLAAAFEPRFDALILSGAGASWLENVLHKESPIATRPIAESLLGYTRIRRTLTESDPVLSLLQWAGEEADAAVYAPLLLRDAPEGEARDILMFQGIVDTYIPPEVANALTLALGIDLAGEALERTRSELDDSPSVLDVLPLRGRSEIAYPAIQNLDVAGDEVTAVVAQHPDDGIEDGHEVMWQTEPPRTQIRCFLRTILGGPPVVADPDALPAACVE